MHLKGFGSCRDIIEIPTIVMKGQRKTTVIQWNSFFLTAPREYESIQLPLHSPAQCRDTAKCSHRCENLRFTR
jgi:hypothetical protein